MDETPTTPDVTPISPPRKKANLISLLILAVVLLLIPVTVIFLGQQTRQELKAANECKTPPLPDPADCVGGNWKLYKTVDGCIRFQCTPQ